MRPRSLVLLAFLAFPLLADELCGTSAQNDAAIRAIHERRTGNPACPSCSVNSIGQAGLPVLHSGAPVPVVRDGAIYLQADENTVPGYHPFDLDGRSLVFEPNGTSAFRVRNDALRYVEPKGAAVRDFQSDAAPLAHELPFTVSLFGRSVSKIWITSFNSIQLDEPVNEEAALQVDAVEGAMHAQAVISPLLVTNRRPRYLLAPAVFVDDTPDAVVVTWRSSGGQPFRYDIQAEIRKNGSVVFSYKEMTAIRWGAPVVSPGVDSDLVTRTLVSDVEDGAGDLALSFGPEIRNMLDVRKAEVFRVNGSDLFSVRLTLAAAPDPALLSEGQTLLYYVDFGGEQAQLELERDGTATVISFTSERPVTGGASARVSGNTIEFFGRQRDAGERELTVQTWIPPLQRFVDSAFANVTLDAAPRETESDLSTLNAATELPLPIMEAFTLAPLDPYAVHERLREEFGLNDAGVDAVAIYQSFFTDIIFYAGAYSTGGNPRVSGVGNISRYGTRYDRAPSLLHLNQLTYNYSSAEETASKVMLHEFGHRWLFFPAIRENGAVTHVLNPVSAHPAGYVHTPSAFRVYGDEESSVMGGGYFTANGDGTYRARAANMGYSWTDLYLMGLATRDEVPPWFYLANTTLAKEYWPPDGAVVPGEQHDVSVQQIIDVHGVRTPGPATSQRRFNIVFVLLTEPGTDATDAQVAQINAWRALMERNFSIATGGRASVRTTFVVPGKTRATR